MDKAQKPREPVSSALSLEPYNLYIFISVFVAEFQMFEILAFFLVDCVYISNKM
jgi:hypothetical protein